MALSWGKMNAGHFDVRRRCRRSEEQVQEGQPEELLGPMEQGGQLGRRLGERAVRGAGETWEPG